MLSMHGLVDERFGSSSINRDSNKQSESTARNSLQSSTNFNKLYLINCLKCKLLSYEEYRMMLYIIVCAYLLLIALDLWFFSYVLNKGYSAVGGGFTLGTAIITFFNIIIIIRIIHYPKESYALTSSVCMLLCMIANIVIFTAIYTSATDTRHAILVLNILFFVFQLYASYILYRYWEFVKFNYDEDIS
eukprot:gene23549-28559_t